LQYITELFFCLFPAATPSGKQRNNDADTYGTEDNDDHRRFQLGEEQVQNDFLSVNGGKDNGYCQKNEAGNQLPADPDAFGAFILNVRLDAAYIVPGIRICLTAGLVQVL